MSAITKRYVTSLETSSVEAIQGLLDSKVSDKGENGVADYIGLAVGNIDDVISRLTSTIEDLKLMKQDAISQKELVKEQTAVWLSNSGVDRLDGLIVSSITSFAPAPTVDVTIFDDDAVRREGYIKESVDKTRLKRDLLDGVAVDGAELNTTHKLHSVKVNKRK